MTIDHDTGLPGVLRFSFWRTLYGESYEVQGYCEASNYYVDHEGRVEVDVDSVTDLDEKPMALTDSEFAELRHAVKTAITRLR